MKILKNRIAAIAIAILMFSSVFAIFPFTNAKDYSGVIPTYAYLNATPNPLAVGQTLYIDMWIDKVPATAGGYYGDRWVNFTLAVTLPDGTKTTLGPFTSDAAGGTATSYVPAKTGNYTFVFSFSGETLTGDTGNPSHPYTGAPLTISNPQAIGDVYGPSTSAPLKVTVGTTPAYTIPASSLPTSYWQTPVEAFNTGWYVLNGNWLGTAPINFGATGLYGLQGNVNPYTQPVLSAHILWTKPIAEGGQMGGVSGLGGAAASFTGSESSNYYTGMQYQPKWAPIIINGVLYYTNYPDASSDPQGWTAVNLRTGAVIWTKNTTAVLVCGQVVDPATLDEYGGFSYLWAEPSGAFLGVSSSLQLYDAVTGNYILSVTNPISGGGISGTKVVDSRGDLLEYYVNSTTGPSPAPGVPGPTLATSLTMWNSTLDLISLMPFFNTGMVVYAGLWVPPQNGQVPFSNGIQWSAPLPSTYQGNSILTAGGGLFTSAGLSIGYIDQADEVIIMSYTKGIATSTGSEPGWQIEAGYSIAGSGPATQLWITNRTLTPFTVVTIGPAASGVYVEHDAETLTWYGYNVKTGAQIWGPTPPYTNSLGYYQTPGDLTGMTDGNNLYVYTFGGQIYDFNLTTGATIWVFSTPSTGENNPYGVNPFWSFGPGEFTLAGGVIYAVTGHNYGPPLFSGAKIYAINATTGKEIFEFLDFGTMSSIPVVDGEMLTLNSYDNQVYAFGQGPSKTIVTAPNIGVTTATPVTITGSVTDISSGSQSTAVAANFPNGLPCVSDASQEQFMEAVYEQSPMPTNLTGVPVTLSVSDSNGNHYNIGTATTDPYTGTYGLTWTPIIPGNYTVYATFAGTHSYYGSIATTYFYASSPPATPAPTASPPSGLASTGTVELGVAVVVIVIVICVAVLAVLMLRKRP
jgi:hypothetical protein